MSPAGDNIRDASSGEGEELWAALRTQQPRVLEAALSNLRLTEEMAVFIARSRNAEPHTLGALSADARFRRSYKLILALARNPRTPQRVANALLKHVKIFDLADLSRDHYANSVTRQKVELMLMDRIPALPPGVKAALSRRASPRVIVFLMERSDRRVIDLCLEASRLTEEMIIRALQKSRVKPYLVQAVAAHPRWSGRYRVRYALIRNFNTPLGVLEEILPAMRVNDLRELYIDAGVPDSTKPFIHSELLLRGANVEMPKDVVYELEEDEDECLGSGQWETGCPRDEPVEPPEEEGGGWELG